MQKRMSSKKMTTIMREEQVFKRRPVGATFFGLLLALLMAMPSISHAAWKVYNESSGDISVKVIYTGEL